MPETIAMDTGPDHWPLGEEPRDGERGENCVQRDHNQLILSNQEVIKLPPDKAQERAKTRLWSTNR